MEMNKETLYTIALTQIKGVGLSLGRQLYDRAGSATVLFENRRNLQDVIPDVRPELVSLMQDVDLPLKRAEQELEFMEGKAVQCITCSDERYPRRLLECQDAPLVLYFCGHADLNKQRIVSMVGTRRCTNYGRDICNGFVKELKEADPDILVVSGLAYGIDICSHRAALANGMDTVAVLAHGLDRIYPSMHRKTAVEMTRQGGLLTEYLSDTTPEKGNFVQRNRIVAGLSDVTIVVESAEKGGSLITASLAHGYNREVLAFPGRIYDEHSKGCNRIIQNEMARPLRSAEDLFAIMNWKPRSGERKQKQQELFLSLTDKQRRVVDVLKTSDDVAISQVVTETGMPFSEISVLMFELENMGVVDFVGATRYRLLRRNV
ncbi:MAG: DNA-processing protein DprA [Bacteroidaceae bacterium]|nr:DNA-processing protein DprA [Bacteroidaceae bacterium]